jgi:hypothetical protein
MKYYALNRGTEFKIEYATPDRAVVLHDQGWELSQHPYDTHAEATEAIELWKTNIQKLSQD